MLKNDTASQPRFTYMHLDSDFIFVELVLLKEREEESIEEYIIPDKSSHEYLPATVFCFS